MPESDSETKAARLKEAVDKEMAAQSSSSSKEIVAIKRENNYRCILCCLFPFRMCVDQNVLPDARGGVRPIQGKPVRRKSASDTESDPETEEMIRRVWHDQEEDENNDETGSHLLGSEEGSATSSQQDLTIEENVQHQDHALQHLKHADSCPNAEADSDEQKKEVVGPSVEEEVKEKETPIDEPIKENLEHKAEDSASTASSDDEDSKSESQEDLNDSKDTCSTIECADKIVTEEEEEESTENEKESIANDDDSNITLVDVPDAGLHRSVMKVEGSSQKELDTEITRLSSRHRRSLIARLRPEVAADTKDTDSEGSLSRKGSLRERFQSKLGAGKKICKGRQRKSTKQNSSCFHTK
eukprot:TRINITY_DN8004_c0_g1_i5.p1 TRINITY_DN8004_c0_g1~~TRINITY_DN8004_c0_g1_i5.p1  ORF type:complete len:356 (-),score=122.41 TRINITY_DN8004_c0_g1_i5:375-1442(-)